MSRSNGEKSGFGSPKERVILVIPGLGLLTIALVWSLGGAARPTLSAQVYGGPTESSDAWHGRVLVQQTRDGATLPLAHREVEVTRRGRHREELVTVRTGESGWADFELPGVGESGIDLIVSDRVSGQTLARGRPHFDKSRWQRAPRRGLDKRRSAALGLGIESGVLVTPFWGKLFLRPCEGSEPRVLLHVDGGELGRAELESVIFEGENWTRLGLPKDGEYAFSVRPRDHVVELEVRCESALTGKTERLHLPIVPGAFFVELSSQSATILSARGHETAYFTWITDEDRLSGGTVRLTRRPDGTSEGTLSLPKNRSGLYLVVASSPDGRSPSTVGYPIDGQGTTFDAVDGFLLDGADAALNMEARRARRIRRLLWGYTAALFSLAWILFRSVVAASDARLQQSLQTAKEDALYLKPLPRLPLHIGGLLIALGLSLVLVWMAL